MDTTYKFKPNSEQQQQFDLTQEFITNVEKCVSDNINAYDPYFDLEYIYTRHSKYISKYPFETVKDYVQQKLAKTYNTCMKLHLHIYTLNLETLKNTKDTK